MSAKNKPKAESRRGRAVEIMLIFLECADLAPPVRVLYPMLGDVIERMQDALKKSTAAGVVAVASPVGIISVASMRMPFDVFEIACCFPADRKAVAGLRKLAGGDTMLPENAAVTRLVRYTVEASGRCRGGLAEFFYNTPSLKGGGCWMPVITPLAGAKTRTLDSAAGQRDRQTYKAPLAGMIPYIAGVTAAATPLLWSVRIQATNGRSELVLPVSEEGVVGFFNMRNAADAGTRKAAVRHFVDEFVRFRPKQTDVRCHFRGVEEFEWFGLTCRVVPPMPLDDKVEESR